MARFLGMSPYSNPVESALQSFGTGLRNISALQDITSGNRQKEEAQRSELADLNISHAKQRNADYESDSGIRGMERSVKDKELHTKIANQTYGPGIQSGMQEIQLAMQENRPPKLTSDSIASVLGFADQHSHFGGTKNEESDHVEQAVAANEVLKGLSNIGPALEQHSQQ